MSQFIGDDNLYHWVQHFRLSDDTHAALLSLGAENVNDLWQVYDDVQMLDTLQTLIPADEYNTFMISRALTPVLNAPEAQPEVVTPTVVPMNVISNLQDPELMERAVDVRNATNTIDRWTLALAMYSQQKQPETTTDAQAQTTAPAPSLQSIHRADGKVIINALIDISGSMAGTKLIAVKLGLCALISQLEDSDVMNITSFSDRSQTITGGFQTVGQLKEFLPYLLYRLHDDGSTAFFNSVIEGIRHLRNYSQGKTVEFSFTGALGTQQSVRDRIRSRRFMTTTTGTTAAAAPANNIPTIPTSSVQLTPEQNQKVILIALTDGEDNASRYTSVQVLYRLAHPGADNFMFILLAVDMALREEQTFRSWMELRYCKQISVNIRSGSKLVQIFKEVLIQRILQSDVQQGRFYRIADEDEEEGEEGHGVGEGNQQPQQPQAPIDYDREDEDLLTNAGNSRPLDEGQVFQVLRADLLRQHNNTLNNNGGAGSGDHNTDDQLDYSPAVSRRNSECDFDYAPSNSMIGLVPDGAMSPPYRPTSPAYSPGRSLDDDDDDDNLVMVDEDMLNADPDRDDVFVMERSETPNPFTTTATMMPRRPSVGGGGRMRSNSGSGGEFSLTEDLSHLIGRPIVVDEVANQGQFISSPIPVNTLPLPLPPVRMANHSTSPTAAGSSSSGIDLISLPAECYCPITHQIMSDPVVCSDGHTYERFAIEEWLQSHITSPVTNIRLHHNQLVPNYSLRNLIETLKNTALLNLHLHQQQQQQQQEKE